MQPPESDVPPESECLAPVFPLPSQEFLCVEFPGYVADLQQALAILGGEDNLNETLRRKAKFLELRFRPNNSMCHPLYGDRQFTGSLLLKVRRRGSKVSDARIIGQVENTYRFRGMADFQYLVHEQPDDGLYEEGRELCLIPPFFARFDMPFDYAFRANPGFHEQLAVDDEGQVVKTLVCKSKPITTKVVFIGYGAHEVPQAPPSSVGVPLNAGDIECVKRLESAFERRPVWSQQALYVELCGAGPLRKLRRLLPLVAFYFSSGPWRKLYVRYGYDPRQKTEARAFQVMDLRCSASAVRRIGPPEYGIRRFPRRGHKAQAVVDLKELVEGEVSTAEGEAEKVRREISLLVAPLRQQSLYTLCEVHNREIQRLIRCRHSRRCSPATGWFSKDTYQLMNRIMKCMLDVVLAGGTDEEVFEVIVPGSGSDVDHLDEGNDACESDGRGEGTAYAYDFDGEGEGVVVEREDGESGQGDEESAVQAGDVLQSVEEAVSKDAYMKHLLASMREAGNGGLDMAASTTDDMYHIFEDEGP